MGNKWKRFLSLLLALTMVIGLMPPIGHVHAEEETVATLKQVTAVEGNQDYVICYTGTMRAMANSTRTWGKGAGMDTGVISAPSANYIWTLVPAEDVEDGYMLYNAAVSKYMTISENNAALNDTSGDVFKFTHTDSGFVIKAENVEYGYFNNLGGENIVGGWNSDGTKFDIYKVVETTLSEAELPGKAFWTKVSVDTETVYDESEGLFEYAWDGNSATIWHSNWQGTSDKLDVEGETFSGEIDFGKEYTINWFSFTPRQGDNPSGLVTQASLYVKGADDADWTQVAQSVAFAADQIEKKITFDEQAVRYVKFVAEASNDGWVAISEFNIGHEHTEPEPETGFTTEQITGITGTASSEEDSDGGESKPARYAFDGIKTSSTNFWASEPNSNGIDGNEYLIADLGGKYLVNQVAYTRRTASATAVGNLKDYAIWVSTDGETWQKVAEGTMEDAATATITFTPVAATHVKLTATQSYHWQTENTVMAAAEFEVFKVVCVTHTPGEAATCTTAQTCTVCHTELAPATGHQNITATGAVKPTLCLPGQTGTTVCADCGETIGEDTVIGELPVATVLNGDKLVALNDCEYTYGGNSFTHTDADGNTYYVKPAAGNSSTEGTGRTSQLPQTTTEFTGITLDWENSTVEGTVWINGNGSMHVWTNADKPYWDKCGSGHGWNSSNGTHDLYLFRATGYGTGDVIPGYTQVTSAAGMVVGENYLIAAKKGDDAWYVMHPSSSSHAWDHIALVSNELRPVAHIHGEAVTENLVNATCTAEGSYDSVTYCSTCGVELSRTHLTVPTTEHTHGEAVTENATPATCTTEGSYDSVVYCSVCNTEVSRETIPVPATGHAAGEAVIENVVDATCTTEGTYDTVTYCSVCDAELNRITTTVPAIAHTPGEAVIENRVEPTCTADGSYDTVVYCSICPAELSRVHTTLPATGHTPGEKVVENNVEPTLNSEGSYDNVVYCSVCKDELTRETITVPALTGASAQIGQVKYATFEDALNASKPGDTIVLLDPNGVEITEDTTYNLSSLTVQSEGDVFVVTGGTLTLTGSGTVTGGTAGVGSWTAVWANGGHVIINGGTYSVGGDSTASDPTHQNDVIYTKNGGTVTINGGTFLNDGTVWTLNENDANRGTITVTGGTFQNWNPADNVSEGADTSFVAEGYCSAEQDGTYTVQAHNYESVVTAPTCTEEGYTTYTCVHCGNSYTDDKVPATGHTYEAVVTAPTCTAGGCTTYTCSCGDSYVGDETDALGHSFTDGTCTRCGTGIVVNVTTGDTYADLEVALRAAAAGDTVELLGNTAAVNVLVHPDITLDLNGYEVTADYVVGFVDSKVIDSAGTGKLVVNERNVVLDENNPMIPVYDGQGYLFTRAGFALRQDPTHAGEGYKLDAVACPLNLKVVDLLRDGIADNNIQVLIRLSWDIPNGTGSQEFVFTDAVAAAVYSSQYGDWNQYSKMFSIVINGFENVENLNAHVIVVSDTNVRYVSKVNISITE